MADIKPLEIDPAAAEMVRSMQDAADAIAYAFAVPSLTGKSLVIGIDWAKGFGPAFDKMEPKT